MRLTHLVISNIGPYRERQTIDLQTDTSATGYAFFAENGRGKTTIYNAMRWCLFGEVRDRAKTVAGKKIEGSIRPMVGAGKILMNATAYEKDDPQEMAVILFAEGKRGKIMISRTAKSSKKFARSDDEMTVILNVQIGEEKIVSGSKAQEAIESFFPRELERFFFIDGEALEEYTEMMQESSLEGLQDEVNAVLGIPALLRGTEDLTKMRQSVKSKIEKTSKAVKSSTKARDDVIIQKKKLQTAINNFDAKEKQLLTVQKKLEQTLEQMNSHQELAPLIEELKSLETMIKLKQATLKEAAKEKVGESKVAWKALLWNRASKLHEKHSKEYDLAMERERTISATKEDIERTENNLKEVTGICDKCHQPLPDIEAYKNKLKEELENRKEILSRLKSGTEISTQDLIIKLGDFEKLKPQSDAKERIIKSEGKCKRLLNDLENLRESHKNINIKVSEEAKSNVTELAESKGRQEALISRRVQELRVLREQARVEELELTRLERLSGNVSEDKGGYELNAAIGKLIVTIQNTISSYREKARIEVEKISSDVFVKLINAPDVYSGIKVDKDFKTQIRTSSGGLLRNPSTGQVSMMTISVIDALRKVSGINAPVFLDTPGRSLDEKHKKELLKYFWMNEGHQFLIFAHSGEFGLEDTVKEFKGKLAKAWTITHPGDHDTCFVATCKSKDVTHDPYGKKYTCNACKNEWDKRSKNSMILEVEL